MENWPKVITEIQHKLSLSEKAIAERAGCTQPTISRIKSGKRTPRYDIGAKIMALYGLSRAA